MIDWHHLLGVGLTDYFTGSCYKVEMEKDLSLKKQRLDILVIEQETGPPLWDCPTVWKIWRGIISSPINLCGNR